MAVQETMRKPGKPFNCTEPLTQIYCKQHSSLQVEVSSGNIVTQYTPCEDHAADILAIQLLQTAKGRQKSP